LRANLRRDVLHGRVASQQVLGRDLLDVWVVEDARKRDTQPADVVLRGGHEHVQVLCRPSQPLEVQGHCPEDDVVHPFALEGGEHLPGPIVVHASILLRV
jgi:hypothetical protein